MARPAQAPSGSTPRIIYAITGVILAIGILMMAFYDRTGSDRAGMSVTMPSAQKSGVATSP